MLIIALVTWLVMEMVFLFREEVGSACFSLKITININLLNNYMGYTDRFRKQLLLFRNSDWVKEIFKMQSLTKSVSL